VAGGYSSAGSGVVGPKGMAACGSSFSDFLGYHFSKIIDIVSTRKRVSKVERLSPPPTDCASGAIGMS